MMNAEHTTPVQSFLEDLDMFLHSMPPSSTLPVLKFSRARQKHWFEIAHEQEMNTAPYKYNLLLENVNAKEQHFVGLYVVDDNYDELQSKGSTLVQNGIIVERVISSSVTIVELRIAFKVFSYAFGNRLFVVKVFNTQHKLVACTRAFELVARRNRKRTIKKK